MSRFERRRLRRLVAEGRQVLCKSEQNLAEVTAALQGMAIHLIVVHADGCSPHVCRCQPEYIVERLTPENYAEGQEAQAKWAREALS